MVAAGLEVLRSEMTGAGTLPHDQAPMFIRLSLAHISSLAGPFLLHISASYTTHHAIARHRSNNMTLISGKENSPE